MAFLSIPGVDIYFAEIQERVHVVWEIEESNNLLDRKFFPMPGVAAAGKARPEQERAVSTQQVIFKIPGLKIDQTKIQGRVCIARKTANGAEITNVTLFPQPELMDSDVTQIVEYESANDDQHSATIPDSVQIVAATDTIDQAPTLPKQRKGKAVVASSTKRVSKSSSENIGKGSSLRKASSALKTRHGP